ncbi:MAG TPA: host attachment protein [Plasticicumulans sp.]|nr:host attachment protein [Plasticicumulans sp.]HNE01828.1 host attachment protein [Plasticicumulans sp.]
MTATWILVADASRARLFSVSKSIGPLQEIGSFDHPGARAKTRDLLADGQCSGNGSGDRECAEPRRHEALNFARELSEHLRLSRVQGLFDRLYIAAAPAFLGLLRGRLDSPTAQLVIDEVSKDLTQLAPDAIRRHLPERL